MPAISLLLAAVIGLGLCRALPATPPLIDSCIDCHAHQRGDMADEHDDVPGYVWQSQACLTCHPNGN